MGLKLCRVVVAIVSMMLLAGCAPRYKTVYTFKPPAEARAKMCIAQCQQSRSLCRRLCKADKHACQRSARAKARHDYQRYALHQQHSQLPVTKTVDDFYDTHSCEQQVCDCGEDYRTCYQLCGGEVNPHQQCIAFCGQH